MNRLIEIIAFTPELDRMRQFYEQGVGLPAPRAEEARACFDTAGVPFALQRADGDGARAIQLTFESGDLDADVRRLAERGVQVGPVRADGGGRTASFRDPEGNALVLRQGGAAPADGHEPGIRTVVLNCQNLRTAVSFYHETLGLPATWENDHWVELDAGGARIGVHLRPPGGDHPLHAAQNVAWCFDAPELETWVEEMRARGVRFATAPTQEDWGLYAEAADPDGNLVVFRTPREEEPVEEALAEAFESDQATHAEGMRAPVKKAPGGASRLVLRPEYRAKKTARGVTAPHHLKAAESKRRADVASPRGRLARAAPHRSASQQTKAGPAAGGQSEPNSKSALSRSRLSIHSAN